MKALFHRPSVDIFYTLNTLMIILFFSFLSSCRKNDDKEDVESETAVEFSVAENAYNDVSSMADEAYGGNTNSFRLSESSGTLSNCATITIDTLAVPRILTIDFDTIDCLCKDGNYRRGKIIVTWNGAYRDSGSVHTITFDGYYVNFNKVMGTKTVTNMGYNASGNLLYSVSVNGSIEWNPDNFAGGGTSTYTSSRTREWIAGRSTFNVLDDVYLISGSSSGTSRTGTPYSMSTSSPLRKEIGFRHFTQGVLNFQPGSKPVRTIDYGYVNGGRDNLARVTVAGQTFTITLR